MLAVTRDTRRWRESTASGVMSLATNADLRATFVHAFNGHRRRTRDDNFADNVSLESKAVRANIAVGLNPLAEFRSVGIDIPVLI